MIKKPLLIVSLILAISLAAIAQEPNNFKNLAGPAAEMDAMHLPDARDLGVRSKAAMLPVRFRDGRATFEIPIETTENLRLTLLAPNSGGWKITATNDANKNLDLRTNPELVERRDGEVGLDGVKFPAEVFSFDNAKAGVWKIEITAGKSASLRDAETAGYLVVSNDSPYQLYSYIDTNQTLVGRDIGIYTGVFDYSSDPDAARIPSVIGGVVSKIAGEITGPDGQTQKMRFDEAENDFYRGVFTPRAAGQYRVQITVSGTAPNGEGFIRTSEHLVQVLADDVRFADSTNSELIDDTRIQINLPTAGLAAGRKVIAYGEIWARNAGDGESPVAWLGGMTVAGDKGLPVTFDARWLSRADAKDGFELRNVRIQDADYFITLAETNKIDLTIPAIPENALNYSGEITQEMRMGKRPVSEPTNDAVGGKLMLVHGYCSGGNPFPTSQFSSSIIFNDPNKSRTHDQFANLIKNFGASYPSFGIVAHSQGGAASLHLYTYYWSGLDYATGGSRLIQTVGTPYQGTALAGNLALLGQIFGAGCGYNYDLTYTGASNWLAGIPSWARGKINYYTTSFSDVWWRYDYCNIATDLFLNDPDDGVIEKTKGQLSGALNRGHKTGWCHTSGMRDPAQTSDSSRNSEMNSNASR